MINDISYSYSQTGPDASRWWKRTRHQVVLLEMFSEKTKQKLKAQSKSLFSDFVFLW